MTVVMDVARLRSRLPRDAEVRAFEWRDGTDAIAYASLLDT
jgi:hypothetical protein